MPDEPTLEDFYPEWLGFREFIEVFFKESHRGAALTAGVMLDNLLESTILAFLRDTKEAKELLEGFNAPLGTFSSRISAAYALGLLSEQEYKECQKIRKIRNIFAHNFVATFDDPNIRDLCATLEFAEKGHGTNANGLFITAAISLILALRDRPTYAMQRRLIAPNFPPPPADGPP